MPEHERSRPDAGLTDRGRPARWLRIDTPAKLNLSLRILGRRDDGFHELESRFAAVSLCDRVTVAVAEEDALTVSGPTSSGVPAGPSNLALKAIEAWRNASGRRDAFDVRLWKRIPSEAGMGGGSSDAAAVLWAANELVDRPLTVETLHTTAARLGSDLNFFLAHTPEAFCRGRGELVTPAAPERPLHAVVAKPPFGLSTGAVFAAHTNEVPVRTTAGLNDLLPAAMLASPAFAEWFTELGRRTGRRWELTGSGSAVFSTCRTAKQAARLHALVLPFADGWVVQHARFRVVSTNENSADGRNTAVC